MTGEDWARLDARLDAHLARSWLRGAVGRVGLLPLVLTGLGPAAEDVGVNPFAAGLWREWRWHMRHAAWPGRWAG